MLIVSCIVSTYFKWTLWFLRFVCFGRGSWADVYDIAIVLCELLVASKIEPKYEEPAEYGVTRNTKLIDVLQLLLEEENLQQ